MKLLNAKVPVPDDASMMSALFARVCPAEKFTVEALGGVASPGKKRRWPGPEAPTAVTFNDKALAFAGMPQRSVATTTGSAVRSGAGPP